MKIIIFLVVVMAFCDLSSAKVTRCYRCGSLSADGPICKGRELGTSYNCVDLLGKEYSDFFCTYRFTLDGKHIHFRGCMSKNADTVGLKGCLNYGGVIQCSCDDSDNCNVEPKAPPKPKAFGSPESTIPPPSTGSRLKFELIMRIPLIVLSSLLSVM